MRSLGGQDIRQEHTQRAHADATLMTQSRLIEPHTQGLVSQSFDLWPLR